MQIRLVRLFCLRCSGPTEKLSKDELMYGLGCNDDETFRETKSAFQAKGFIDEKWGVCNWNSRQYLSDSSTERVRKYRANKELKQDETLQKRRETQNVTDQNRTEQSRAEQKKTAPAAFALPGSIDPKTWDDFEEMRRKIRAPLTDRARKGVLEELARIGGDPNAVLVQSITNAWRGVFALKTGTVQQMPKPSPLAGMTFVNGGRA